MRAPARSPRGAALAWALLALFAVSVAATTMADGLARRARLLRHDCRAAQRADLERAATVLRRARERDPRWTGPETLRLAGGSVTIARDRPAVVATAR